MALYQGQLGLKNQCVGIDVSEVSFKVVNILLSAPTGPTDQRRAGLMRLITSSQIDGGVRLEPRPVPAGG